MSPKYALPEIERRWKVPVEFVPVLTTARVRRIEDKYLHGGRLRLRVVHEPGAEPVYKLGKKYPADSETHEHVVSVYLTNDEHESLRVLPGIEVRKDRYSVAGGSLDIYDFPKARLAVFEVEFESEEAAIAFSPPDFVGEEITRDADHCGFALAKANAPIPPGTALPHS